MADLYLYREKVTRLAQGLEHAESRTCVLFALESQRSGGGKKLNDGIPARVSPVLIFQNSAPSLCACTRRDSKFGARVVPSASSP